MVRHVNEQYIEVSTVMPSLAVADFDLDGDLDIAGARYNNGTIRMVYGLGGGAFDPMQLDIATLAKPYPLVTADFDDNGIPDLATAHDGSPGQTAIMLGDGDGAFYDSVFFTTKVFANAIKVGDLNEDGVLDFVVVSDSSSPGLSVLLSNR